MKKAISIILLVSGPIPFMIWIFYVVKMFCLGPRIGWMSDEFLHIEGVSLLWFGGSIFGVLLFAAGCETWESKRDADKKLLEEKEPKA